MKRYKIKTVKRTLTVNPTSEYLWAIYDTVLEINIGYSTVFCDAVEVAGQWNGWKPK